MDNGQTDALVRSALSAGTRRVAVPAMLGALFGLARTAEASKSPQRAQTPFPRPDDSKIEEDTADGILLKEDGADDEESAARRDGGGIGTRQIYFHKCETFGLKLCGVRCPASKQAISGGVLDLFPNAFLVFDRPGATINSWKALIYSTNGRRAKASVFAVCINK